MKFCNKTTIPESAVNVTFNDEGISSVYTANIQFQKLSKDIWKKRQEKFERIVSENKKNGNYDCVVGVSGGKDSYFQVHICLEYGLRPLLVTYHGNNFLPEGDYNRDRMRDVFNCDHIIFGPGIETLKKLNRICFKKMGDMNWQNHCGIFTYPITIAAKFKIPLIVWGEVAWDISGMFSPDDYVEFSNRVRKEHSLRGFDWKDMVNNTDERDKLEENDLLWTKYPDDSEIADQDIRGIYIGNYFNWDPNSHVKLVMEKYGWKPSEKPFERTYRNFSNLDDRYENGIHDLMKFIKFGYGRATDHTTKDIISGYMTRDQGIEMVRKYDHVVSSDLYFWLDYVDMKEDEFWKIADSFRSNKVWRIVNNKWVKDNIWGGSSEYGEVHLSKKDQEKYIK